MKEEQGKLCILACETLTSELESVMKTSGSALPVFMVESGKHLLPDRLRESIQYELDGIPAAYGTVLLLFGFCGNAMVGVKTGEHRAVLPKAADCIPIFLGSRKIRNGYGARRYFFTEGYRRAESHPVSDYARLVERYSESKARAIMCEMLQYYEHLSIIETGVFDVDEVIEAITGLSKATGVPEDVLPGDLRLIRMLIEGDWPDDEFLVLEPGSEITLHDAMAFQSVSQIG
jgi:hypothetical protein